MLFTLFIGLIACSEPADKLKDTSSTKDSSSIDTSPQPSAEPDDSPDTSDTSEPDHILTVDFELLSGADSSVLIDVDVPEGVTAMQFDIASTHYLQLQYIIDPNNTVVFDYVDWITTNERLFDATVLRTAQVSVPWPARMSEAPVEAGRWSVMMVTVDSSGNPEIFKDTFGRITMKRDSDFSQGQLRILVGKATGVSDNPAYEAAIDALILHAKTVYGEWGIELDIREEDITIAPDLPPFVPSSTSLLSAATYSEDREVLVLFADSVDRENVIVDNNYTPGPLMPTYLSLVGVSWEAATGGDGQLDSSELEILKEELIQGIAHYMGLRHVVDSTGSPLDALSDTESCSEVSECETLLGSNIMFPYPVCTTDGCTARTEMSAQQIEQLHLFVGVD